MRREEKTHHISLLRLCHKLVVQVQRSSEFSPALIQHSTQSIDPTRIGEAGIQPRQAELCQGTQTSQNLYAQKSGMVLCQQTLTSAKSQLPTSSAAMATCSNTVHSSSPSLLAYPFSMRYVPYSTVCADLLSEWLRGCAKCKDTQWNQSTGFQCLPCQRVLCYTHRLSSCNQKMISSADGDVEEDAMVTDGKADC